MYVQFSFLNIRDVSVSFKVNNNISVTESIFAPFFTNVNVYKIGYGYNFEKRNSRCCQMHTKLLVCQISAKSEMVDFSFVIFVQIDMFVGSEEGQNTSILILFVMYSIPCVMINTFLT